MKLTPLETLRLMTLSSPTKAPLRMNSTFDVSIEYESGLARNMERRSMSPLTLHCIALTSTNIQVSMRRS